MALTKRQTMIMGRTIDTSKICRGAKVNHIEFNGDGDWEQQWTNHEVASKKLSLIAHIPYADDYKLEDIDTLWPPKTTAKKSQIQEKFTSFMRDDFSDKYTILTLIHKVEQKIYSHPPKFLVYFNCFDKQDYQLLNNETAQLKMKDYPYFITINSVEVEEQRKKERILAIYQRTAKGNTTNKESSVE